MIKRILQLGGFLAALAAPAVVRAQATQERKDLEFTASYEFNHSRSDTTNREGNNRLRDNSFGLSADYTLRPQKLTLGVDTRAHIVDRTAQDPDGATANSGYRALGIRPRLKFKHRRLETDLTAQYLSDDPEKFETQGVRSDSLAAALDAKIRVSDRLLFLFGFYGKGDLEDDNTAVEGYAAFGRYKEDDGFYFGAGGAQNDFYVTREIFGVGGYTFRDGHSRAKVEVTAGDRFSGGLKLGFPIADDLVWLLELAGSRSRVGPERGTFEVSTSIVLLR